MGKFASQSKYLIPCTTKYVTSSIQRGNIFLLLATGGKGIHMEARIREFRKLAAFFSQFIDMRAFTLKR